MSPIDLLYVSEMWLAVLAPVVAAVCIVLALVGHWQSLCRRLLLVGAAGGCILGGLWLMSLPLQREIVWAFGVAIFGIGFAGAIFVALAWQAFRRVLLNTTD
jgi:hypothetical protein